MHARLLATGLFLALVPVLAPYSVDAQTSAREARLPDFAQVAEAVSPSVVSLRVEAKRQAPPMLHPFFGGQQEQLQRGMGSGVIIRADGYILTNNHVVAGADRIEVRLHDNRRFEGRVIGTDPSTDLAVVKIEAKGLRAARFADSRKVKPGQWAVAIGSPFGLDYTVTTGVVSAVGRGGFGMAEIEDFVQTDASINPGNSGGPLVDLDGHVIGINTMIHGRGTGIGFAAPADLAERVATQLIEHGVVRRAFIGVGFQDLTPALSRELGVDDDRGGAIVSQVVPDGPAARAGVREGDVVIAVDGRRIHEGRELQRAVVRKGVGASLSLEILRDGKRRSITVTTDERPEKERVARAPAGRGRAGSDSFGLSLGEVPPSIAKDLGLRKGDGVVVAEVQPNGAAARAGLERGDVIVEADRKAVRGVGDVDEALSDGKALLRIRRRDGAFYTVLER
jgi:serine protease Do